MNERISEADAVISRDEVLDALERARHWVVTQPGVEGSFTAKILICAIDDTIKYVKQLPAIGFNARGVVIKGKDKALLGNKLGNEDTFMTIGWRVPIELLSGSAREYQSALAHIRQLEEQIALMKIQMRGDCGLCKYSGRQIGAEPCESCLAGKDRAAWEYVGLPEVHKGRNP